MTDIGKDQIQKAFNLAGSQHRYQKILILLNCLLWVEATYVMLGPTLIYIDPIFTCTSTGDQRIQESNACSMIDQCKLIDNFSLTSKLSLYCDLEWSRNAIQSIFSIGSFIGLLIMNILSDTKGRKIAIVISLIFTNVGVLLSLLGGIFENIPLLMIAQFISGFGSYPMAALGYTLLSDSCTQQLRSKGIIIINSAWGISTSTLGVFFLLGINWLPFLVFIILIPLIGMSIVSIYFFQQSPYLLVSQNKKAQALQCLTRIAIVNKRENNLEQIQKTIQLIQFYSEQSQANLKNVLKVISEWSNLKAIILLSLIFGTGNLGFYSVSFAFDFQGYGFGINSIIAGFMQLLSATYLHFYIDTIKRRQGIAFFYGLAAMLGLLFFITAIGQNLILQTSILAIARILSTIAQNLQDCLEVQSFKSQIQSTAIGVIQAFSLFGALLAPLLVDLADKIGVDPIAFFSLFMIFAVWPNFFLKQTLVINQQGKKPVLKDDSLQQKMIKQSKQSILTCDQNSNETTHNNFVE